MPGFFSVDSRSPRPIPPKRPFADSNQLDPSSPQPGTTKRFRIETEEAEQEAKIIQQQPKPLPLQRTRASFLDNSADLLYSSPFLKRYLPKSVNTSVTQWLESVSESESHRERHCRSDTLLGYSGSDLIPRRLTTSAPDMEYKRDTDGFALPPTSAPTKSCLYRADWEDDSQVSWYVPSVAPSNIGGVTASSSPKSLVEDPYYRETNLAANNIYMRSFYEEFPEDISRLIRHIRKGCGSLDLALDQVKQDTGLEYLEMGTRETDVERYFHAHVFPNPESSDVIKHSIRIRMAKHAVLDFGSMLKVSIPHPDMLYGYNRTTAFPQQQVQLRSMGNEIVANSQSLVYPFFVIEFKADGPGGSGSMWAATNQCLGASASCVNMIEQLNCRLGQCQNENFQPIESAVFSIAMNGTEARLYISWKHDNLITYAQKIDSFLLQKNKDYKDFCEWVRKIINWGKDKRLRDIRDSLNSLFEESKKTASQMPQSCVPPSSNDSASCSSRKRTSSSSSQRNRKAKAIRGCSGAANAPPSASF